MSEKQNFNNLKNSSLSIDNKFLFGFVLFLAVLTSIFHILSNIFLISAPVVRIIHLFSMLSICFFSYQAIKNKYIDVFKIFLFILILFLAFYSIYDYDNFFNRAVDPNDIDITFGITLIVMILLALYISSGAIMSSVVFFFILYAYFGAYFNDPWGHRGYDIDRIIGHLSMTLEGIYGPAIGVSSTLIILFTIFGAFLSASGAGNFFVKLAQSLSKNYKNSEGFSVVLSSFFMGIISGSGVATTVTVGSITKKILEKSKYDQNTSGGLLSASGIGAILCPPIMGAAAFLMSDFLGVSYFEIIKAAFIPALIYYISLFLMVYFDNKNDTFNDKFSLSELNYKKVLLSEGLFLLPIFSIIFLLIIGFSPIISVLYSLGILIIYSFIKKTNKMDFNSFFSGLANGSISAVNVAITCAGAGIIVGVISLTGLGLKFSSIVIELSNGSILLTAFLTMFVVWFVGLAVPVTASYIICAVIAAPALIEIGVSPIAAHLFIFYFAVLSEVSPPTALSPFAASAILGGNPYKTTLKSWYYCLPAFLIPYIFIYNAYGNSLIEFSNPLISFIRFVSLILGLFVLIESFKNKAFNKLEICIRLCVVLLLIVPHFYINFFISFAYIIYTFFKRKFKHA